MSPWNDTTAKIQIMVIKQEQNQINHYEPQKSLKSSYI